MAPPVSVRMEGQNVRLRYGIRRKNGPAGAQQKLPGGAVGLGAVKCLRGTVYFFPLQQ